MRGRWQPQSGWRHRGVNLSLLRPAATLDLAERLDRGQLDLCIGRVAAPGDRFADLRLFEDGFAALVRRGHPAAGKDKTLSREALRAYPHLAVSSAGHDTGFVDEELARRGEVRRVALHTPLVSMTAALAQSDMIAVIDERIAASFAAPGLLEVLALPFESPRLLTAMLWHRRMSDVPAHRWLRDIVRRVARSI